MEERLNEVLFGLIYLFIYFLSKAQAPLCRDEGLFFSTADLPGPQPSGPGRQNKASGKRLRPGAVGGGVWGGGGESRRKRERAREEGARERPFMKMLWLAMMWHFNALLSKRKTNN